MLLTCREHPAVFPNLTSLLKGSCRSYETLAVQLILMWNLSAAHNGDSGAGDDESTLLSLRVGGAYKHTLILALSYSLQLKERAEVSY
jgi:hypothetical protein